MKLKKFFLTIAIIAILSVTFVLAVSASEYDFIPTNDENLIFDGYLSYSSFDYTSDEVEVYMFYLDNNATLFFQPHTFKLFVDAFMCTNGNCDYSNFIQTCENVIYDDFFDDQYSFKQFCGYWCSNYYGLDEACFNKFYYYKEITQEELDAKDEQIAGMSNSLNIIDGMYQEARAELVELQAEKSELTTQNENLQSSVEELSGANTKLQYQIDSLEVQVADLVNDKTEINTQLMALDAKLEREVAKSYLQGYEDATGFNWLPVIGGLSVLSMVVTIISLCVRARKKKR